MVYRVQVFVELTHVMIRWSPGIEISICQKAFIPAWILEETESVLLNLGKCSKPKDTHKPRMHKRENPNQREVYLVVLTGLYPGRGEDS